ncbi:cyclic GMP-AMP synthase-like receptor 2 [Ptychodera flava]|uniref:cyclic GMP-AMP synthase-like receptor 2 n=1 Tax=Ptychodera flava TaxID=63121 RepID=UPI00396A5991
MNSFQNENLQRSLLYVTALTGGNYTTAEFDQTIDVALVLSCIAWPSEAQEWISRARQWPSSDIVQRIVREGCHVVPKAYPGEEDDDELQWRLSFSLAERTLANTFMPWQRTTYLVLKKLWRRYLKEPKVISSYHLKTTMFWVSEKITPNQWQENNIGRFYLAALSTLIEFLTNRKLPNFFLPDNNMIGHVPNEDVQTILEKLVDIRKKPRSYLDGLVSPTNTFTVFSEEAVEPCVDNEYGQHAMYRQLFNEFFFKL